MSERHHSQLAVRHLRFGWWALLVFLSLGIVIETLHGFKIGFYMEVANATRRLMWTLSHAHGTLLALINLVFAASVRSFPELLDNDQSRLPSRLLIAASVMLPAGFFLGGIKPEASKATKLSK